jgi:putative phosphoesterase
MEFRLEQGVAWVRTSNGASMRIGIVSDTHSRHGIVLAALELLRAHQVDLVLHCGDIEDVETVELFVGLTTHFVFGNCDDDRTQLRRAMQASGAILHEPFGQLELAGRKLAFIHSDDKKLFQQLETSGQFDFLFYGHTHIAEEHQTGPTRVINPGALHRARPKTFVVLDLPTGAVESVVVEP